MSATDIVIEKAKDLTDEEAKAVLTCIAHFPRPRRWTARELLLLPLAERSRILEAQATEATEHYRNNPDLIVEDVDPPFDYEGRETL